MTDQTEPTVVPFPEREQVRELRDKDPGLVLIVDNTGPRCPHDEIHVREGDRTVRCGKCSAVLDAFNELYRVSKSFDRIYGSWRRYRADIVAMEKRIELLQRLEKNARARCKRAGVEVPDKWHLDAALDGRLGAWIHEGKVWVSLGVGGRSKGFSVDELRREARNLLRLAEELERESHKEPRQ